MTNPTYTEIATDYRLWGEYVDTGTEMSEEEFDALSVEQKVALQIEAFGPESRQFQSFAPIARSESGIIEISGDRARFGKRSYADGGSVEYVLASVEDSPVMGWGDAEAIGTVRTIVTTGVWTYQEPEFTAFLYR